MQAAEHATKKSAGIADVCKYTEGIKWDRVDTQTDLLQAKGFDQRVNVKAHAQVVALYRHLRRKGNRGQRSRRTSASSPVVMALKA